MLRIKPYRMIINVWQWLLCSSQSVSPSAKRVLCTVLTAWTWTFDTFWLTWDKFMRMNISEQVIFSLGLVFRENCTISTYRLAGKWLKRSLSSIQFTYSFHTSQNSLLLTSNAHNLEGLNLEHLSWGQLAVVFHLQLLKVAHIATLQHKSLHVCITCCFVDVAVSFSLQVRIMGKVFITSHSLPWFLKQRSAQTWAMDQFHSFSVSWVHRTSIFWSHVWAHFPDRFPDYAWTWQHGQATQTLLGWGCKWQCSAVTANVPPTFLAEWLGSFMCYCGNTVGRADGEMSAQKVNPGDGMW